MPFTKVVVYKFYSLLGHACRVLLNLFSSAPLNKQRELSDTNLLFFCGKKGARMLKPVLLSIYNRWEKIPNITIVTDGTPEEYIAGCIRFWPFPYEIKPWTEAREYHRQRGRHTLLKFADNTVFGKKLCAILAEGETKPTLYCDTDVLWFSDPILPDTHSRAVTFRMSTDNAHTYSKTLITGLKAESLLSEEPLNAGVIFISGSVYDHPGFFERITDVLQYAKEGVAEQTAFALASIEYGDRWTLENIIISTEDIHWPFIPRYFYHYYEPLFARHHVLTKNSWFWRDALYLFLFRKKKKAIQPVKARKPAVHQYEQ